MPPQLRGPVTAWARAVADRIATQPAREGARERLRYTVTAQRRVQRAYQQHSINEEHAHGSIPTAR